MHAVFNRRLWLANHGSTARHRASKVLEIARDRHVEQAALKQTREAGANRRLVLLSLIR